MYSKEIIQRNLGKNKGYATVYGIDFNHKVVVTLWKVIKENKIEIEGNWYFCSPLLKITEITGFSSTYLANAVMFLRSNGCIKHTGSYVSGSKIYLVNEHNWLGD